MRLLMAIEILVLGGLVAYGFVATLSYMFIRPSS